MGRIFPRTVTMHGTIRIFSDEWRDENGYPGALLDRAKDLVFVYIDAPGAVPILVSTTHQHPEDPNNLICRLARHERPAKDAEIQKALVAAGEAAVALYQANAALREAKETPADMLGELTRQREAAGLNARRAVELVLWLRAEGHDDEDDAPEPVTESAGA